MNVELGRILKEVFLALQKYCPVICPEETEENGEERQ
jgi:hypothetical protein